jgi:hypothetical protein
VQQARTSMEAFLDDPSSIAIMVNLVALGRKPPQPAAARLTAPAPRLEAADRDEAHAEGDNDY